MGTDIEPALSISLQIQSVPTQFFCVREMLG